MPSFPPPPQPPARTRSNDYAIAAVVLAAVTILIKLKPWQVFGINGSFPEVNQICMAIAGAGLVMSALAIRRAVRVDRRMAMALTGLVLGLIAFFWAVFALGIQRGASFSTLGPQVAVVQR